MPTIYLIDLIFFQKYYILLMSAFIILPFLDQLIPENLSLPRIHRYTPKILTNYLTEKTENIFNILKMIEIPEYKEKKLFKLLLYSWVPCAYLLNMFTFYHVYTNNLTLFQLSLVIISQGVINGSLGAAISHELFHKQKKLDKLLGFSLLLLNNYMHFHHIHIKIHHNYVATDEDPASAKINESIYWYLPKNIILNLYHYLVNYPLSFLYINLFPIILMILLLNIGEKYLIIYLSSSLVSVFIMESGNYIQHYGLRRRIINDAQDISRYEDTNEWHSWNCFLPIYNLMLVNLPNTHSEHHIKWTKSYNTLKLYPYAPRLPFSFPFMILLAMMSPFFKSIMNPLIELYEFKRREFERKNNKIN
jgi:alkane 1-monooxygenase